MGNKKESFPPSKDFLDSTTVMEAARIHDSLPDSAILAQISEAASTAIREIEDIYWNSPTFDARTGIARARNIHSDDLIEWIKTTGISPETLSENIKGMVPGEISILADRAFVKTPTNEFQEVGAYVNRLEKTLLMAVSGQKKAEASLAEELQKSEKFKKALYSTYPSPELPKSPQTFLQYLWSFFKPGRHEKI